MGHERIGFLPLTSKWRQLVTEIGDFGADADAAPRLAHRTLHQVRRRLDGLEQDTGLHAAFSFILALCSRGSTALDPDSWPMIDLDQNPSPLEVTRRLNTWIDAYTDSLEYAELAKRSAADAIAYWTTQCSRQQDLFHTHQTAAQIWGDAATGSAFSEISRVFFGKLLERYLKYFLEREASTQFHRIEDRDAFSKNLTRHVDSVARHAFEASKITQSFAAGWFNKNARDAIPTYHETQGFLSFALSKLRQELQREAGE